MSNTVVALLFVLAQCVAFSLGMWYGSRVAVRAMQREFRVFRPGRLPSLGPPAFPYVAHDPTAVCNQPGCPICGRWS